MSNIKTEKVGVVTALIIVFLAFGAFAGAAAIITKNQLSLAPFTLADDEDDDDGEDEDEEDDADEDDEDEEDDKAEEVKKKAERERESVKKKAERERESVKKQSERARESVKKKLENSGQGMGGNDLDSEDDFDTEEQDNDHGMFKDRDKTLEKLRKEIAKARENILEKQAEGVDVTAALARLALAEASLLQVGSSFDANDLSTAKMLAKQIKKTAHFAKEDLHDAEKIADELAKVQKRFGQVTQKIAALEALGGDATAFKTQLASLRSDFAVLQTSLSIPGALTRDMVKAFEKRVKRLKSLVESTMFALGGTDDDDLFEDHEDDADDLFEDLNDVAEIEDDDDNNVSEKLKDIAAQHKGASKVIKKSLEDIKDRDGLAKILFGSDSSALEALNSQVAAMNTRATALESAAAQVTDPDIKQILISQASTLRSEVLKLQAYITAEDNQFSIFGRLIRLFR